MPQDGPYGNWTRDTSVTGWRDNRFTNGPDGASGNRTPVLLRRGEFKDVQGLYQLRVVINSAAISQSPNMLNAISTSLGDIIDDPTY